MIIVHIGIEGTRLSEIPHTNGLGLDNAQLEEHWTSIPKVAGLIPTVVRLTFQPARCGCTLRVTSQNSFCLN